MGITVTKVEHISITHLLLDDKTAAESFCLTERAIGTIRREMKDIPRWSKYLGNYGALIDAAGMKEYIMQRGSQENKQELKKYRGK